ncbi:hypothetical protein [Acinetobacter pittii]|uniref:hypothetical protein n=1 Tax=Acinetobacter pittii TaxID=48296 RepID=UPI003BA84B1C
MVYVALQVLLCRDITVAVLNNAASTGLVAINDASKEKLIEFIKKLHDQIDE